MSDQIRCCASEQKCNSAIEPHSQQAAHAHTYEHQHEHSSATTELIEISLQVGHIASDLLIEQMDCPTEERLIRQKLEAMHSVSALQFNLMQRRLKVHHQADAYDAIVQALESIGLAAVPFAEQTNHSENNQVRPHTIIWRLSLAGIFAIGAELIHQFAANQWLGLALALVSLAIVGPQIFKKGWIAVKNLNFNINALMSIAVTGAVIIGQWPEAAMVMWLFAIAEEIEARSLERARNAVKGLMGMAPETALVWQEQQWQEQDAKSIALGSVIRLRPGERVALDGEVVQGQSSLNQAAITGESMPVEKQIGDKLFAGSINLSGELHYKATALASNSTLARIIHMVEEAQASRAPTQRFIDSFSRYYTPAVMLLALVIALLPPLLFAGAWSAWIYKALVILVIACPCALVISTPVAVVSALTSAARQGILIKGGAYLEQGRHLTTIAFDKTGTLTIGKPQLIDSQYLADNIPAWQNIAYSLSQRSDHPVSLAVSQGLLAANNSQLLAVDNFTALLGLGSTGDIDGTSYWLGNLRLMQQLNIANAEVIAQIQYFERQGKTCVSLANQQQVLAIFAVADSIRETTAEAMQALKQLGITTIMLSGDNQYAADNIAQQAGIAQARGELLPNDKLAMIQQLQQQQVVGMVGDGINDAPALAHANIGFAMGAAGTDTAIETADVALMDDDLRKLPQFIRISQRTSTVLRQNISFALLIKLVFLGLALTDNASMWMAVFADMGASLIVIFNSLRLLKKSA